jgi:phage terminase large subunit-like protein
MSGERPWKANPPRGTAVCGGFDGSENDDHTAIKLETREGLLFTPRYGPDRRPTIWDPKQWGGKIPRHEVNAAWSEIAIRYRLLRVYYDPGFRDEMSWESEGEAWDQEHGPKVFIPWVMSGNSRMNAVYSALRRFEADLKNGGIKQDGCPITETHMANARKVAKPAERYGLGKPSQHQKIDVAVTSVLTHEAASDMRAEGWPLDTPSYAYVV